mmetsp:Transcript_83828/g.271288  ORF Transcript_83828/g.271288 Transcript_83828/m.271288 type:complete len:271 (-) Transcript_83828:86-898(-)
MECPGAHGPELSGRWRAHRGVLAQLHVQLCPLAAGAARGLPGRLRHVRQGPGPGREPHLQLLRDGGRERRPPGRHGAQGAQGPQAPGRGAGAGPWPGPGAGRGGGVGRRHGGRVGGPGGHPGGAHRRALQGGGCQAAHLLDAHRPRDRHAERGQARQGHALRRRLPLVRGHAGRLRPQVAHQGLPQGRHATQEQQGAQDHAGEEHRCRRRQQRGQVPLRGAVRAEGGQPAHASLRQDPLPLERQHLERPPQLFRQQAADGPDGDQHLPPP